MNRKLFHHLMICGALMGISSAGEGAGSTPVQDSVQPKVTLDSVAKDRRILTDMAQIILHANYVPLMQKNQNVDVAVYEPEMTAYDVIESLHNNHILNEKDVLALKAFTPASRIKLFKEQEKKGYPFRIMAEEAIILMEDMSDEQRMIFQNMDSHTGDDHHKRTIGELVSALKEIYIHTHLLYDNRPARVSKAVHAKQQRAD